MATLVLSAVGTAIGGPLGGSIGALLGNHIDNSLLAKSPDGPRLTDLAVQTSQYGTLVPRIYGHMRVAGTVIWATDLVEHRDRQGGKGQPSQNRYSYSVSFAVALSSRRLRDIGRIWADGNLLRGADGDFKTDTGFRFYAGAGDQPLDPFIAGTEGAEGSPAFRDYAYCVFEDFDLSEYGNRIPSLTFEVMADHEKLSPIDIMQEFPAIDSDHMADSPRYITGYALNGESWRDVIAELGTAFSIYADWGAQGLRLLSDAGLAGISQPLTVPVIAPADRVLEDEASDAASEARDKAHRQPAAITMRYYEPERDFQAGLRRSAPGFSTHGMAARSQQLDLPAAMQVDDAQITVQNLHARQIGALSERTLYLASIDPAIRPGSVVQLTDQTGLWRVHSWTLETIRVGESEGMACHIELSRLSNSAAQAALLAPVAGRSVRPDDHPASAIGWALADMPCLPNAIAAERRLFAAAWPETNPAGGWRHADIYRATADGGLLLPLGRIDSAATTAATLNVMPSATGLTFAADITLDVVFAGRDAQLESADSSGLNAGLNVAMLGDELIQFGRAEWLGDGRYRLSEIYRALGDGRGADTGHAIGSRLILLDSALLRLDDGGFSAQAAQYYAATSPADDAPLLRQADTEARALKPLAPVHAKINVQSDGNLMLSWIRRDRHRPDWSDGPAGPMAERSERYLVSIMAADAAAVGDAIDSFESDRPQIVIPDSQRTAWQAASPGMIKVWVQQIGDYGLSEPVHIALPQIS